MGSLQSKLTTSCAELYGTVVKARAKISNAHKTTDNILRMRVRQGNLDLNFVYLYAIVSNKSYPELNAF